MLSINLFILFVNSSLTPTFSLRKEKVGPKETNCGAAVFIWVEKFLRRGALSFWQYGHPADISIKKFNRKIFFS